MITRLHIRNYAIIEQIDIHFSDKLTIITGETGAGKSILLGALGLIMGNRVDTKVLYNTEQKCVIQAYFDIQSYDLKHFFEENELDYDTELVIHREITPSGKSRAFINDTPVALTALKQLTATLIDLHQQFDTLDIHQASFQLQMIDALAGNKNSVLAYDKAFKNYTNAKKRLQQLLDKSKQSTKEMDFWLFQLEELANAKLQIGEQEEIEQELKVLNNAENIKQNLANAYNGLVESENAVSGQVRQVMQQVGQVRNFHPDLETLYERLEASRYELQDIASELDVIAENTEYDPERIEVINDRLNVIYKLQQKHQVVEVAELIAIQTDLEAKTAEFSDLSGEIGRLQADIDAQEENLYREAEALSVKRKAIIPDFEAKVHAMLTDLAMPYAQFKVTIETISDLTNTGTDRLNFLFSANKGAKLEAIKGVASGGETARLTLCTKSLVASAIPLPTMIFDEIDTGVSGDVALRMGNILHNLARKHQVIVITHTPQIASKGDSHYFVYKQHGDDRTITNVKELNPQERVKEIAIMLSGNPPTTAALENASQLLAL